LSYRQLGAFFSRKMSKKGRFGLVGAQNRLKFGPGRQMQQEISRSANYPVTGEIWATFDATKNKGQNVLIHDRLWER